MKRNILCGLAASLLSVSLLVSPALAQSPGQHWELVETKPHRYFVADTSNPGAGWTLVDSETVRYFVPGTTPPAGAELAEAGRAPSLTSQTPSSNEWLLVSTDNVKDFIPDGSESSSDQLISSTFVGSRIDQQTYAAGREKLTGTPTYDAEVRETDTKNWRLASQTATVRRYDVPIYQNVHTPYKIVDRSGYETRTVDTYDNTYRANRTVKTALGQEIVDTHTYTKREDKPSPWVRGAVVPALDKLVSEGVDHTVRTTYLSYVVDLLAGKVTESSKTQASKTSTFYSDTGTGNKKTSLSGSQKRMAFKADAAVGSTSKTAGNGGSIVDSGSTPGKSDEAPGLSVSSTVRNTLSTTVGALSTTSGRESVNIKASDWDKKFYNPTDGNQYLDFSVNNGNSLSISANVPGRLVASGWSQGMLSSSKETYADDDGTKACNLKLSTSNGQWILNGTIKSGTRTVTVTNWVAR